MITPVSFVYEHDKNTGVATVRLNRPEKLNALTFDSYEELCRTFRALDTEPGVRAIVMIGTGRGFCSGGDVNDIIGELTSRDFRGLLSFTRMTGALVLAIRRCRRPVVAAINGTAAGAGAVIAIACDVRIAASSARIGFVFTKVGLSGADMGAAWLLPRIVGFGRASELLLTGAFVTASEACDMGLYNHVVPDDQLAKEARTFAEQLATGPSFAHEITKDALNREANMDLAGAIEAEAQIQAALMLHPDFREAYEAFVAKRPPRFV